MPKSCFFIPALTSQCADLIARKPTKPTYKRRGHRHGVWWTNHEAEVIDSLASHLGVDRHRALSMILFCWEFGLPREVRNAGCSAAADIAHELTELSRRVAPDLSLALMALASSASGLCAILQLAPALSKLPRDS